MEKFCKYCGNKLNEDDKFCQNCGAGVEEVQTVNNNIQENNINNNVQNNNNINNQEVKTNPSAIGSLVCSLVGLLVAGIIMGTIAICLGVAAKKHMKIFTNEKGAGLATAGIVIGIVDISLVALSTIISVISIF